MKQESELDTIGEILFRGIQPPLMSPYCRKSSYGNPKWVHLQSYHPLWDHRQKNCFTKAHWWYCGPRIVFSFYLPSESLWM